MHKLSTGIYPGLQDDQSSRGASEPEPWQEMVGHAHIGQRYGNNGAMVMGRDCDITALDHEADNAAHAEQDHG